MKTAIRAALALFVASSVVLAVPVTMTIRAYMTSPLTLSDAKQQAELLIQNECKARNLNYADYKVGAYADFQHSPSRGKDPCFSVGFDSISKTQPGFFVTMMPSGEHNISIDN